MDTIGGADGGGGGCDPHRWYRRLLPSDHGLGGFVAVELMAVAPSYDIRTTSSTHTITSKGEGLNGHYRWCGWWRWWR